MKSMAILPGLCDDEANLEVKKNSSDYLLVSRSNLSFVP
jgi:hypothetical protein